MSAETKILLVEDDLNLGFVIQDALKMNHFKVTLAKDGKEGLKVFSENDFDICLFDVMLPKKDGFSLAEDVRKLNAQIPIIFLTAKSQTEDKIKGFKLGADDYITKPFNMDELVLRIEAILKRSGGGVVTESQFHFSIGSYSFDAANYILSQGNESKTLTKKEADILKILCEQKGKVVERELILNMVWGDDSYFNGRSLDVFITKLRKYLVADSSVSIKNIHGVGFSLEDGIV
jgi:DNA-binding response OmpR family regulator